MMEYLKVLFEPGELICTGDMYSVAVHTQDKAHGNFISINPLKDKRLDANVTAHRNFLIEMDQPGLGLEDQMAIAEKARLPWSVAVWSGSKSVHFIVSLEKPLDEKTWRAWAAAMIKAIPGADQSTKNPSRFSRLPGAYRADKKSIQKLIAVKGRRPNELVAKFLEPHLIEKQNNFRALYNQLRGLSGIQSAHPMTKAFIAGTHPCHMGRNNALFRSACDLKDCGLDETALLEYLLSPAINLGLSEWEAVRTIKSAYRK
jgi:hypothetical protein